MNTYKIVYKCNDGYEGEEIVCAVNRMAAFMIFEDFGIEGVVSVECYRVLEDE